MVNKITSFGRNGVHDYLLVRVTSLVLIAYTLYILFFFWNLEEISYYQWLDFWGLLRNKVFTMFALVSVLVHAWIGLWQVLTDYIKNARLRAWLQCAVIFALLAYVFTGLFVLWGA